MWPLPVRRYLPTSNQREHRRGKISGLSQWSQRRMCKLGTGGKLVGDFQACFWGGFPHLSLRCSCCVWVGHKGKGTFPEKHPMCDCNMHLRWPTHCVMWRDILEELENIPRDHSQAGIWMLDTELRASAMWQIIMKLFSTLYFFMVPAWPQPNAERLPQGPKWQQHGCYMSLWVPGPISMASVPSLSLSWAAPKPPPMLLPHVYGSQGVSAPPDLGSDPLRSDIYTLVLPPSLAASLVLCSGTMWLGSLQPQWPYATFRCSIPRRWHTSQPTIGT